MSFQLHCLNMFWFDPFVCRKKDGLWESRKALDRGACFRQTSRDQSESPEMLWNSKLPSVEKQWPLLPSPHSTSLTRKKLRSTKNIEENVRLSVVVSQESKTQPALNKNEKDAMIFVAYISTQYTYLLLSNLTNFYTIKPHEISRKSIYANNNNSY